jgi:uncharacterized protein (DUF433 family)
LNTGFVVGNVEKAIPFRKMVPAHQAFDRFILLGRRGVNRPPPKRTKRPPDPLPPDSLTLLPASSKRLLGNLNLGGYLYKMPKLERITLNPTVMGGKPCIRGLRVTVGTVVGLVASGRTRDEILRMYPYLEAADIDEAMAYAAWRVEEQEVAVVDS